MRLAAATLIAVIALAGQARGADRAAIERTGPALATAVALTETDLTDVAILAAAAGREPLALWCYQRALSVTAEPAARERAAAGVEESLRAMGRLDDVATLLEARAAAEAPEDGLTALTALAALERSRGRNVAASVALKTLLARIRRQLEAVRTASAAFEGVADAPPEGRAPALASLARALGTPVPEGPNLRSRAAEAARARLRQLGQMAFEAALRLGEARKRIGEAADAAAEYAAAAELLRPLLGEDPAHLSCVAQLELLGAGALAAAHRKDEARVRLEATAARRELSAADRAIALLLAGDDAAADGDEVTAGDCFRRALDLVGAARPAGGLPTLLGAGRAAGGMHQHPLWHTSLLYVPYGGPDAADVAAVLIPLLSRRLAEAGQPAPGSVTLGPVALEAAGDIYMSVERCGAAVDMYDRLVKALEDPVLRDDATMLRARAQRLDGQIDEWYGTVYRYLASDSEHLVNHAHAELVGYYEPRGDKVRAGTPNIMRSWWYGTRLLELREALAQTEFQERERARAREAGQEDRVQVAEYALARLEVRLRKAAAALSLPPDPRGAGPLFESAVDHFAREGSASAIAAMRIYHYADDDLAAANLGAEALRNIYAGAPPPPADLPGPSLWLKIAVRTADALEGAGGRAEAAQLWTDMAGRATSAADAVTIRFLRALDRLGAGDADGAREEFARLARWADEVRPGVGPNGSRWFDPLAAIARRAARPLGPPKEPDRVR